jgi:TonB family protein
MEPLAQPPADDVELHLLTEWGDPSSRSRGRSAAVWSVAAHIVVIFLLTLVPAEVITTPERPVQLTVTPLIEPPVLTQKSPNAGKVAKEFRAASRPKLQLPEPPAPAPAAPPKKLQQAVVTPPAPKKQQPVTLPDAPQVPAEPKETPKTELPVLTPNAPPPPQIQAEEKKTPFDNPTGPRDPGIGRLRAPDTSVQEAIRQTVRGGGTSRPPLLGPPDGEGAASSASPGELPQLLSDPLGVDFKPYLTRILAIVRRNWFAVYPESAKLGMRGKVSVLFSITKTGTVARANYAAQSGVAALDRAAIAAISASNPFPPLPSEYKGDRIVLQFNFAYNMPK